MPHRPPTTPTWIFDEIVVPAGDSAALADALLRLAGDAGLRARMGRAARERYGRLFSPEAVLPVLLGTYRRVAGRDGAGGPSSSESNVYGHPWAAALERESADERLRVGV